MSEKTVSPIDARLLAVAVTLEPALSLARVLRLPLDDVQTLVADGYFREHRRRGLSLRAIARHLDKSLRTVATLSKQSKSLDPPLSGSERLGFRRRLLGAIGEGVSTADELAEYLSVDVGEVSAELDTLVEDGVVVEEDERHSIPAPHVSMIREDVDSRLESLRHFLSAITQVIYKRFFIRFEGEAFARVLSFQADPEALAAARDEIYTLIRDRAIALDGAAEESEEIRNVATTFCLIETDPDGPWAPR